MESKEKVLKIKIDQYLPISRQINRTAVRLSVEMAKLPRLPRNKEYMLRLVELRQDYAKYGVRVEDRLICEPD